jgi:Ca2+-binding EF-hand superfamily protein
MQRKEIAMVSEISGFGSCNAASLSAMRQKMFNQIDSNGDGSIDKSELSALSGQNTSSLVDEIFGKMDTDQDSLVSMIEFDATLAKLEQQMKKGDSGMPAMSGMPPPPPDKVFDTADANGDGSVTQEELTAVLGQRGADVFSQVDTDGDGKISRTEDEAFRVKMEEQMKQNASSDSGMNTISSSDQDWKSMLFEALVKGLTAYSSTSSDSSSLYA